MPILTFLVLSQSNRVPTLRFFDSSNTIIAVANPKRPECLKALGTHIALFPFTLSPAQKNVLGISVENLSWTLLLDPLEII